MFSELQGQQSWGDTAIEKNRLSVDVSESRRSSCDELSTLLIIMHMQDSQAF